MLTGFKMWRRAGTLSTDFESAEVRRLLRRAKFATGRSRTMLLYYAAKHARYAFRIAILILKQAEQNEKDENKA